MRYITCRLHLYNLKTKKELKIYIIVRLELSISKNTQRPETQTMLQTCLKQLIQFINQQKVAKKWPTFEIYIFYIRQDKISCNVSIVYISENIQNKIYNLQIRLEQFTDLKKCCKWTFISDNTKSPQALVWPQFLHMSEICCATYRPNSYNLLTYQNS